MCISKLFSCDIKHINSELSQFPNAFSNKKLIISGGTGFIGKWILEAFLAIKKEYDINFEITVISRNSLKFIKENPYLGSQVKFINGDITDNLSIDMNFIENYDFGIFAATDIVSPNLSDTIKVNTTGIINFLDIAKKLKIKKILLLSSGAVYGKFKSNNNNNNKNENVDFNIMSNDYYQNSKIFMEWYGGVISSNDFSVISARIYALIGPYINLNSHFAVACFIKSALNNEDIIINGDGKNIRSYMYAADLSISLLKILAIGKDKFYNLGSNIPISIYDLAIKVNKVIGSKNKVIIQNKNISNEFYVPNISNSLDIINITNQINLDDAIIKTYEWYRKFQ